MKEPRARERAGKNDKPDPNGEKLEQSPAKAGEDCAREIEASAINWELRSTSVASWQRAKFSGTVTNRRREDTFEKRCSRKTPGGRMETKQSEVVWSSCDHLEHTGHLQSIAV